jgi:hypothetical protein
MRGRRAGVLVLLAAIVAGCSAGSAGSPPVSAAPVAPGSAVYVSPTGSDAAPGTKDAPLRTPQRAVDRLPAAGGTVELQGGTYRRTRIVLDGRSGVTVRAAAGAHVVLDAAGLVPPDGLSGLVEISDSSSVTVQGLELTGYRTASTDKTPVGIYLTGSGAHLTLRANHVHDLGNDNATRASSDINAHGIAVYGTSADAALTDVRIVGNEVDHLRLGASEAVVVNGNVDGWSITSNRVHDNDNIGIDAIGYEETIGGADRYTDVNRARHGVIDGNSVSAISSQGNPAYAEDDGYCRCADGIYVDGATDVVISANTVTRSDIGIEVAAEDPRGKTNAVRVTGNAVTSSAYVGLAIGGYDPGRGEAYDVTVSGNRLTGNNTLRNGAAQLLLQSKVHAATITDNTITATTGDATLVERVETTGPPAQNAGVVLDRNRYQAPVSETGVRFVWLGRPITGFAAWQQASRQDRASSFRRG